MILMQGITAIHIFTLTKVVYNDNLILNEMHALIVSNRNQHYIVYNLARCFSGI